MSFGGTEKSRYRGRPTNLFFVRYGSSPGSFYAYTDADRKVVHNGVEYQPIAISRGKIVASGSLDKSAMEVRCSLSSPMAELFRVYPPSEVVNITIFQGHLSDPDAQFLVAYTGRVVGSSRERNELVLSCEPISTSLKRVGLRRHYQYSCPHALYGPQCRASKEAATTVTSVLSISGVNVTLISSWATPDRAEKYLNGMIEWTNASGDTEVRTILRVTDGVTLTLTGNTRGLKAGAQVKVILGCNHGLWMAGGGGLDQMTDCHFLHGNIQNFGGCPFIPKKNPIGLANQYY